VFNFDRIYPEKFARCRRGGFDLMAAPKVSKYKEYRGFMPSTAWS
jgi:hypothetical protein